jgi:hypothetical protein
MDKSSSLDVLDIAFFNYSPVNTNKGRMPISLKRERQCGPLLDLLFKTLHFFHRCVFLIMPAKVEYILELQNIAIFEVAMILGHHTTTKLYKLVNISHCRLKNCKCRQLSYLLGLKSISYRFCELSER